MSPNRRSGPVADLGSVAERNHLAANLWPREEQINSAEQETDTQQKRRPQSPRSKHFVGTCAVEGNSGSIGCINHGPEGHAEEENKQCDQQVRSHDFATTFFRSRGSIQLPNCTSCAVLTPGQNVSPRAKLADLFGVSGQSRFQSFGTDRSRSGR